MKSRSPEIAIAKGSVEYFLRKNIISVRKAKYTIGIGIIGEWIEEYGEKGKKVIMNNKCYCDNLFSRFIKKNEEISYDKIISNNYIMDSPIIIIELFKSDKDDIFFCDEKDENGNLIVSKLGELIIDAKDKYDPLKKKLL